MEVKNGIIIDGVLHEMVSIRENYSCDNCSLEEKCDKIDFFLCTLIAGRHNSDERFINRGKVTVTLSREESKNVGEIYRNGVKIDKEEL